MDEVNVIDHCVSSQGFAEHDMDSRKETATQEAI